MSTLPATFQEKVAAKISETIAELIPQEDINRLVEAQIKQFVSIELPKMIKQEIETTARRQISDALCGEEFQCIWKYDSNTGSSKYAATEFIKEMLVASAPEIFASVMQQSVVSAIQLIRNNTPRY